MKFIILFLLISFGITGNPIGSDCTFRGKKLFGTVRAVQAFGMFKVRISQTPNLRVETVKHNPFRCGEWRMVQAGEDFTIEFVQAGEDFTIEFVNMSPGLQ